MSIRKIADAVGAKKSTVGNFIKRIWEEPVIVQQTRVKEKSKEPKWRFSEQVVDFVLRKTAAHQRTSCASLALKASQQI